MTTPSFLSQFRKPADTCRSVPFYSLNDELDPVELDRQLRAFREGGFGGTFLHSRIGLLTPYLSERWFEVMAAGVKSSQELGMDAWFYDEDKWPSGFAGGIVPLQDSAFQARSLLRVDRNQPLAPADTVLHEDERWKYVCHVFPMGSEWFNGTAWVDLMNPDAVKAFLDCSYAPYVERYGGQPRVRGIFTDEPQVNPWPTIPHAGAVCYSPFVADAFRERTGWELFPRLPALFEETGDWRRVRLAYYRTVAACFEEAFSRQVGDYCRARGFTWTGHYNGEDSPSINMMNAGGLMQQLRHMEMPGIDALGLRYNTLHCGKVMTSVANQYGRRRRLSELFGIGGHNMTFEDRMWITSWHTLMGVNFMCPHLSLYSMKGERKRDYPPTISPHQPYWRYNHLFEDYSARLCLFASSGEPEPEVCVLSPIETNYLETASGRAGRRDTAFERLLGDLMRTHRNIDLGDEQILSEIGTVDGERLVVGAMAYRIVVLPPMLTIRATTLGLLARFAASGGRVLGAGEWPKLVDGEENVTALAALQASGRLVPDGGWRQAMDEASEPLFRISGDGAPLVWTHLRRLPQGHLLQVSNTSRLGTAVVALRLPGQDPAVILDPVDGRSLRPVRDPDGSIRLELAPARTWLVGWGPICASVPFEADFVLTGRRSTWLPLDVAWRGRRIDPNSLTLDFAAASRDGGRTWSSPEPVLAIYDRFAHKEPYRGELKLRFEAEITDVPRACSLAVEQPGMYRTIDVNGHAVDFAGGGFHRDVVLRTCDVTPLLRTGMNSIVLTLDFVSAVPASLNAVERYGSEIESIYLLGDFAVAAEPADQPLTDTYRNQDGFLPAKPIHSLKRFTITGEAETFRGDLVPQGYPFYAGEFVLEAEVELPETPPSGRVLLSFPAFEAVILLVQVNGSECPPLFASPWEVDVTGLLRAGPNRIRVALTNSLRNLLGPHHHKGGEHTAVGPATFRANHYWPNREPGERDWYDARLTGKAKTWRDDYYLIPFGLLQPPVLLREEG